MGNLYVAGQRFVLASVMFPWDSYSPMKNPVRNVVVEYKNKRARKGNVSLWGDLDLKSIARQVEADTPQATMDACAEFDLPEPRDNRTEVIDPNVVQKTAPSIETIEAKREPSVVDVAEPERAIIVSDPVQKLETVVRRKNRSVLRGVKKAVSQKTKTATCSVATMDICAELLYLEQENASLKRELIAKLRAENANLCAMLERAEQRSITDNR
ncbi:hypothetical protein [Brucella tritici]|nr:hypothetical protein [Brucella tritici]